MARLGGVVGSRFWNHRQRAQRAAAQYSQIVVLMGGSRRPDQKLGWRNMGFTKQP